MNHLMTRLFIEQPRLHVCQRGEQCVLFRDVFEGRFSDMQGSGGNIDNQQLLVYLAKMLHFIIVSLSTIAL